MTTVWLNGSIETVDEARVSAFDAGFQHGVGLFETMSFQRCIRPLRTGSGVSPACAIEAR